ncbi:MAG: SMI1/KNR4 family protein [Candidimonas sp.]|nr:SMI1/KNR4 family protein [Candidimonas sp.]
MENNLQQRLGITESRPVIAKDYLALEKRIGAAISDDLRIFFSQVSGGIPERSTFSYGSDGSESSLIQFFFAISGGSKDNDLLLHTLNLISDRLPQGALPIAEEPGGHIVFVYLAGPKSGEVWLWEHDRYEGEDCLQFIAKDLDSFVSSLSDPVYN